LRSRNLAISLHLGCLVCIATAVAATEPAKKPAAAPAPASHAAAPAAHGTAAGAATPAAGAGAAHGATTGGAAAHPVTTGGAASSHPATTTTGAHGTAGAAGTAGHASAAAPAAGSNHAAAAHGSAAHGSGATFAGHPAPKGSHELHAANGAAVRTRADGTHSDIHDPKRGMDIHHGLNGDRRVAIERADHSRIVAMRGGHGYVQHPYMYHGREFGHRTYYEHGRAYDRFYGRYPYHGHYYEVYAPARYYPYGYYHYAYAPWPAPVPYVWTPAVWSAPYGYYYAPYAVYPAPAFWLTDFVFASSLAAAYAVGHEAAVNGAYQLPDHSFTQDLLQFSYDAASLLFSAAQADAAPALSPQIKQLVADEVKLAVQNEGAASQAAAAKQETDQGAGSVVTLLGDGHAHVFVAGTDLDLVSDSGAECAVSQGDVLKVSGPPSADADTIQATVLASKGSKECAVAVSIAVPMSDLQDMQNHMRETIDDGLADMQKKQGKGGLPSLPASAAGAVVPADFAADAPPPDADAGKAVAQQLKDADAAEQEVTQAVTTPAATEPGGAPVDIALGQTLDAVTASLGKPLRIIDLGAKKIYTYQDMKITFTNGKVSDVQ
jgi:hypothetical protein